MAITVKHSTLTGLGPDPSAMVDGQDWDAAHTVTGAVEAVSGTTDGGVPRFDGAAGELQNSSVIINDLGAISTPGDFSTNFGRIVVGDTASGGNNSFYAAFVDDRLVTLPGTSLHAFADNKIVDASGGFGMNSFDSRFNVIGSQNYNHIQQYQAFCNYGSTGKVNDWTGYTWNPTFSGGGSCDNLTGIIIGEPVFPGLGGAVNLTCYGIQIGDQTLSGAPFVRAIQTFGPGMAEFGGAVRSRVEFEASATIPVFRLSSIDPGTGATTYGSISHDGTVMYRKSNGSLDGMQDIIGTTVVNDIRHDRLRPGTDNTITLGDSTHAWSALYANTIFTKVPTTLTGTSGTVGASDSSIIFNASGTFTATLPAASTNAGRWLQVKSIVAQTINSASSNIVPRAGGAAGTTLLASGAGNWASLQSDGTSWIVMAGS